MCLEDGHPSIVEYYELTDEMRNAKNEKGEPAYNFGVILNYLFRVDALDGIMENPFRCMLLKKRFHALMKTGSMSRPKKPNGFKYETLILDMIRLLNGCMVFEVERAREFAPVKNRTGG